MKYFCFFFYLLPKIKLQLLIFIISNLKNDNYVGIEKVIASILAKFVIRKPMPKKELTSCLVHFVS